VEFDAAARSVLERHWPNVPRLNDVREVSGDEFGSIDLICGGFPCQDVSVAGRRAGLAGERSGLWHEFHRLIDRAKPGTVVIENVPGLLSSNGGRDFATVLRGLVECGYGVAWRILDAQYFGVPQRRRRVFIVGSLGAGCAAEVLFESEGGGGFSSQKRTKGNRHSDSYLETASTVSTVWAKQKGGPAGSDWRIVVPIGERARRYTPRETERLQGFPDDWTSGQKDSPRYRQLGNAVAVPVAEWIGRRIVAAKQQEKPQ